MKDKYNYILLGLKKKYLYYLFFYYHLLLLLATTAMTLLKGLSKR